MYKIDKNKNTIKMKKYIKLTVMIDAIVFDRGKLTNDFQMTDNYLIYLRAV